MKKILFASLVAAAMMVSCSWDKEQSDILADFDGNVIFTVEPFTFDGDETRASLTNADNNISFAWDKDEAVGIFPIASDANVQTKLTLKDCIDNNATSSFRVAGWTPFYFVMYAAYYPFQNLPIETSCASIPVVMTGQTHDGNASLAHISAGYDYMGAVSGVPTEGDMNFEFKHITSIIMLELTMPDTATWESVTLSNNDGKDVFTTSAMLDLSTGEIASKEKSSEVTLSLKNVCTTETNKTLTLYLSVLPTTTGELTLTAKTSLNKLYGTTIASKNLVEGKAYRITTGELSEMSTGIENGYEWVDLCLPSGLKWATMNVGATSVTDYGKYYAWGETKAYGEEDTSNSTNYSYNSEASYIKTYYDWKTYKWCAGKNKNITKYCTNSKYGTVDNKTILDPEDDAATQNWGGAWRMPTEDDMSELLSNCYLVWTSNYNGSGIAGCIVYAAKSVSDKGEYVIEEEILSDIYSLSDAHIFLPAAGYVIRNMVDAQGISSSFWTSSLASTFSNSNNSGAYYFGLDSSWAVGGGDDRCNGNSVRAVCESKGPYILH